MQYWLFQISPLPSLKFQNFETFWKIPKSCGKLLKGPKAKFNEMYQSWTLLKWLGNFATLHSCWILLTFVHDMRNCQKEGKFHPLSFQNLAVKNERVFNQKLLVLTKFHLISFCLIPKYSYKWISHIPCNYIIPQRGRVSFSLIFTRERWELDDRRTRRRGRPKPKRRGPTGMPCWPCWRWSAELVTSPSGRRSTSWKWTKTPRPFDNMCYQGTLPQREGSVRLTSKLR